ncbi:MAG TPA: cupin domain-containing protein [Dongiaceae bacterium]|jgi:mannose-6-phosphate isomerase-like protein (cupin superfamily)
MARSPISKISLASSFHSLRPATPPLTVADINGTLVKVGKFKGAFVWHSHADEDELFWCLGGRLTIQFRDCNVDLGPGEMVLVPRGVEHRSVAAEEAQVAIIHPATTIVPAARQEG